MKKIFLSFFFMSAFLFLQAEVIDLNGEAKTLTSSELSSEFTNTSETLTELTLDVPQNATNTFSGKLSGNIKLVKTGKGTLRHIVTRIGVNSGETMLMIVTNGKDLKDREKIVNEIMFPEETKNILLVQI